MTNLNKKKEKWEDEFDDMWSNLQELEIMGSYGGGIGIWEDEKIKKFIRKLLSQQTQELKEKIKKIDKEHGGWCSNDHNYHAVIDDILKLL